MEKRVEILAPAGSYDSFLAAIAAGADAVYIGGTRFGARAYADNLNEDMMLQAIDYAHLHGRRVYMTVNTLLKENELNHDLYSYLLPYYMHGLDGVIVQDIGVLCYIREQFPDLPIHASTQMTITNVSGAKFLEALGVERVVTSRELQLNEIKEIAEQTNLEIESFVHGALCYCYSGQCLYSSMIGGRSGNRGQCAQPCRLPYSVEGSKKNSYVLSLKDMCTLEYIPELIENGIYSFKIEGRMKKPEYVAQVTAMYRKYVDLYFRVGKEQYKVENKDKETLLDLYNRGGFHSGYYHTQNGPDMLSLDRPNHAGVPALKVIQQNGKQLVCKALVELHKGDVIEIGEENYTLGEATNCGKNVQLYVRSKSQFVKNTVLNRTRNEYLIQNIQKNILENAIKEKIQGTLFITALQPMKLKLNYKNICVEVEGDIAQEALTKPMDKERIEKQMRKTGNTEFEFDDLQIEILGNVFVPLQSLNELRRNALECMRNAIVQSYRRNRIEKRDCNNVIIYEKQKSSFYAYVEHEDQFDVIVEADFIRRIYVDCNLLRNIWNNVKAETIIQKAHQNKKEIFFVMPHVFRKRTKKTYNDFYDKLFLLHWDGVMVRNYESYQFLREHHYSEKIVTDSHLYQFNSYAKRFWLSEGVEGLTAPLELNVKELNDVGVEQSEVVVYGYAPMMISAQCIQKTMYGCKMQKGQLKIRDRYKKEFVVKNLCDYCYNVIYNCSPTVLLDQKEELLELNPKAMRLHFTIEDKETVKHIIQLYNDVFQCGQAAHELDFEFTRGHFKRGIK